MLENGMRRLERLGINEREKKKITLTSYKFCISTLLSTPETQYAWKPTDQAYLDMADDAQSG